MQFLILKFDGPEKAQSFLAAQNSGD